MYAVNTSHQFGCGQSADSVLACWQSLTVLIPTGILHRRVVHVGLAVAGRGRERHRGCGDVVRRPVARQSVARRELEEGRSSRGMP